MPYRLAFIADYFPPHVGGMETWTLEVARVLVRLGHTVVVFTPKLRAHENDEVMDGVEVKRFGPSILASTFSELKSYPYVARVPVFSIWLPRRMIRDRKFDAVIVTYVSLGFVGWLLRLLRIPTWAIIHGFYDAAAAVESHGIVRGLMRIILQEITLKIPVTGYIVVGNEVRAALARRGIGGNRLHAIYGGANIDEIDAVSVGKSVFPQVCFISRMIPERRLDDLLRAFSLVLRRLPQARLIAVGDGPLRKPWEELALTLKINRNVRFTGALRDEAKIRILKQSHVLAHPSTKGMSLAIYESLGCSTPYVAYDIPEIKEQTGLTGGGILVKSRDIQELGEAMLTLLRDQQLRDRLSREGRKAVEMEFQWKAIASRLIHAVESDSE
jgi:glycosyltransferase involved in cell wall biosynthesis